MKSSILHFALGLMWSCLCVHPALAATGPQFMLLHGIRNDGTVWDDTEVKDDILGRDPCVILQPDTHWRDNIGLQALVVRDALAVHDFQGGVAIGYSQGGLVAREYLRQNPGQTRIRSLITMGTGHLGAPILENLLDLPALFYPLLFAVADAALVDFGWLVPGTTPDGAPYFGIYWRPNAPRPEWAVTIVNALVTSIYFQMIKPVQTANSSDDQTPGSPFLTTLNGNTSYQSGIRRASIQGVEGFPELYLLGASALGISDGAMIDAVNRVEHYTIYQAINAVLAGSVPGFAAYYTCYRLVNSAPHRFREELGRSATLPFDPTSDGVVPAISQVMPDAEPDDGSSPLLYRANLSNHLDHMHHPNVLTAMRSALSTFGDTGPGLPAAPTNVHATDAAGPVVMVDWNDVEREQNYFVYRNGAWIGTLPANQTHYLDVTACYGQTYTYVIAASNCAGTTNDPVLSSDTGSRTANPPPVPANVVASDCATQHFVRVTWTDVAGEDGYRILRSGVQIAQVGANVTQYDDATSAVGQVNPYSVKSYSTCNGESAPSTPDDGCRVQPPPAWVGLGQVGVPMRDHVMTYDERDARLLAFGGADFTGALNDLWETHPTYGITRLWTSSGQYGRPSPRQNAGLVYSPSVRGLFTYGGTGTAPWNGDLWMLDLYDTHPEDSPFWYPVTRPGGPIYEGTTRATYDATADRMLVVAPYEGVFAFSFASWSWSQLYTGSLLSPARIGVDGFHCIHDPVGNRLLVFGGAGGSAPNETVWALSLTGTPTWTPLVTSGLSQVSHGTMVWDSEAQRVLLYGGTFGSSLNADVWVLSVTGTPGWTRLTTLGSAGARYHHAAGFDRHKDQMLVWGGVGTSGYTAGDAWALTFPDVIPPGTPEFFEDAVSRNMILIAWLNSGDDGESGTVMANDIRWATYAINESNFATATPIPEQIPGPAGSGGEYMLEGLSECTRYWLAMKSRDEAGNESPLVTRGPIRTLCLLGSAQVAEGSATEELPTVVEFGHARPNPATSETQLQYGVPASQAGRSLDITVFDVAGRAVRTIAHGSAVPGRHGASWNLTDGSGQPVGNGIYYVRFRLGTEAHVKRVAVTR